MYFALEKCHNNLISTKPAANITYKQSQTNLSQPDSADGSHTSTFLSTTSQSFIRNSGSFLPFQQQNYFLDVINYDHSPIYNSAMNTPLNQNNSPRFGQGNSFFMNHHDASANHNSHNNNNNIIIDNHNYNSIEDRSVRMQRTHTLNTQNVNFLGSNLDNFLFDCSDIFRRLGL
jgi:hypothetical protein